MSAKDKNRISIDIYGVNYMLVGTSSVSHMKTIAAHVNEQMHKISKGNSRLDTPRLAVLAAVNMADELFKLQAEMDQLQVNKGNTEKALEEYKQLQEQYAELKNQLNAQIEWNTEQSAGDAELLDKYASLQQELQVLQESNRALEAELQHVKENKQDELQEGSQVETQNKQQVESQEDHQALQALQEEHNKLKEEYRKLQNEYNEWIELAESNPPQ